MTLIGLCGSKSSGKDTVASHLIRRHGFYRMAFATPLKDVCATLFLLSEDQCHDPSQKEETDPRWGLSPRRLFQMVGTDWVRAWRQDFWVDRMRMDIEASRIHYPRIVVADVRFENEKNLIESMGGIVIGITRDSCQEKEDQHPSETECKQLLTDLDTIRNDGSIEELYDRVDSILMEMGLLCQQRLMD